MGDQSANASIVLIGTGNAAAVLGRLMRDRGHQIMQVWGRSVPEAHHLAAELDAVHLRDLAGINHKAAFVVLAVSDDAIPLVVDQLPPLSSILVHTAGSVPAAVLQKASPHYGVLYPLQSLRKNQPEIPPIPFLVQGSDHRVEHQLRAFARSLSGMVSHAADEDRRILHLGAVFTANFTNHLCTLADDYLRDKQLDFRFLLPLLSETIARMESGMPAQWQTGPAIRGDQATQEKHLAMLGGQPDMQAIYSLLSASIHRYHQDHTA